MKLPCHPVHFLGTPFIPHVDEVVARLSDAKLTPDEKKALQLGISRIPAILQDNTDRNRTSPLLSPETASNSVLQALLPTVLPP